MIKKKPAFLLDVCLNKQSQILCINCFDVISKNSDQVMIFPTSFLVTEKNITQKLNFMMVLEEQGLLKKLITTLAYYLIVQFIFWKKINGMWKWPYTIKWLMKCFITKNGLTLPNQCHNRYSSVKLVTWPLNKYHEFICEYIM